MLVLGIETSCDETAVALVGDGPAVRVSLVASQEREHAPYGGVVPELASRRHLETLPRLVAETLARASVRVTDLDGVAATYTPGLVGALLVGLSFAKGLAYGAGRSFIGVHHLEAHLAAIFLEARVDYPYLGLVVSGGHTNLYRVERAETIVLLGRTRDDAAGEAFDKVAALLGLGYPGGRRIDAQARDGNPAAISFPRPMLTADRYDMSFSGLKTAVAQYVRRLTPAEREARLSDLCASFQEAIVDVLVAKTFAAAERWGLSRVVVTGGVAANSRLRARLGDEGERRGVTLFMPSPALCTDNAAMVAYAGARALARGARSPWSLNAVATGDDVAPVTPA